MSSSVEAFRTFQLKEYHDLFLKEKSRTDGRRFEQFRDVLISKDTISTADGSCMVKLGNTTFAAGISATIVEPKNDAPKAGFLNILPELPPICINHHKRFRRQRRDGRNDESVVLGERIQKALTDSNSFPLDQLCIEPGKAVWKLDLQTICLDFDGNYFDAAFMSILGALSTASVPEVKFKTKCLDVEFLEGRRKLVLSHYPIPTSYAVFNEQILLADPTHEEEQLSSGQVHIIYDAGTGTVRSVSKDGGTGLDDQDFQTMFENGIDRAKKIHKILSADTISSSSKR